MTPASRAHTHLRGHCFWPNGFSTVPLKWSARRSPPEKYPNGGTGIHGGSFPSFTRRLRPCRRWCRALGRLGRPHVAGQPCMDFVETAKNVGGLGGRGVARRTGLDRTCRLRRRGARLRAAGVGAAQAHGVLARTAGLVVGSERPSAARRRSSRTVSLSGMRVSAGPWVVLSSGVACWGD